MGHAPSGNPSSRRTVEVGAVEWNAKLDASSDSLSELYFLRARYYDPVTGRFLWRDPIEFNQRYAYVGNNPVLLVDPRGLRPVEEMEFEPTGLGCLGLPRIGCLEENGVTELARFGR